MECGMCTRAEHARALLIASGLPRFLWEEAMRHTTWLQNRTPTCALDGKTLYEMKHGKKPFLGGIQEFGVAAYVKDLKAGKLDSRAQQGRFVSYDSKSKGYRIYWPKKKSITVERNIVFNENDVLTKDLETYSIGIQSEGEKEKVIQYPKNHVETANDNQNKSADEDEPIAEGSDQDNKQIKQNTILFPSSSVQTIETEEEDIENQYR